MSAGFSYPFLRTCSNCAMVIFWPWPFLAPGIDLTAYRIVQEALTNAVRHFGAGEAAVTVSYEPGTSRFR